jgi:hypothetical protein
MTRYIVIAASTALALSPALALAAGNGSGSSSGPTSTGQPNQSCQDINGGNTGPYYPGHTSTAPGSAFNETDGIAGGMYAGSQPQNSNNSASVSQYDVACSHQPG